MMCGRVWEPMWQLSGTILSSREEVPPCKSKPSRELMPSATTEKLTKAKAKNIYFVFYSLALHLLTSLATRSK
eukprot:1009502-Pelagomonas_calceolata.AAC.2